VAIGLGGPRLASGKAAAASAAEWLVFFLDYKSELIYIYIVYMYVKCEVAGAVSSEQKCVVDFFLGLLLLRVAGLSLSLSGRSFLFLRPVGKHPSS
jgi:hypothetical protein